MKLPGNMQAMMQKAEQMQKKMQEEIAQIRVEASAGGGMVSVKMDGHKNVTGVKIDAEVAGDVEMLQELVMAACNEATKKVDEESQRATAGLLSGLGKSLDSQVDLMTTILPYAQRLMMPAAAAASPASPVQRARAARAVRVFGCSGPRTWRGCERSRRLRD